LVALSRLDEEVKDGSVVPSVVGAGRTPGPNVRGDKGRPICSCTESLADQHDRSLGDIENRHVRPPVVEKSVDERGGTAANVDHRRA
jgi:hypothetical protein